MLHSFFHAKDLRAESERIDGTTDDEQGYYLGALDTTDSYRIGFFYYQIQHGNVARKRVGLRNLVKSFVNPNWGEFDAALVVFDSGELWRLSFVSDIKGESTAPKRYTYVFGESDNYYNTPVGRFYALQRNGISFENIKDTFSVEALTQEFYNKLYNWFLWAKDKSTGVTFPNDISTQSDDRDKLEVKMVRLITRMLFVWFIKQKQLVSDNLFDKDFLSNVLRDFNPEASDNGDYYNAILQNLFFATLNQERVERGFVHPSYHGRSESYSIKNLYRDNKRQSWFLFPENEKEERVKALFYDIPYLNGGLFECLDKFKLNEEDKLVADTYYDGFSTKDTRLNGNLQYRAFIPNKLFFALEHNEKVALKEATESTSEETQTIAVMGLLELFKQYNFTVEENTTSDKEVSLDPELLGRVFENLLAAYNPETQESARKATGSFYTPREIVDYMVEESLIAYLSGKCGNDADEMRHLVKDEETSIIADSDKVISDLKNIKILDPACGSGAFPMGILLKITDIIERLTPQEQFNRYETKLEIIKNCIYGIDIQSIAMLICKLRFFISLICDCDKDETKENLGIVPLPNLETKFVAANSLLPAKVKEYDNDWTQDEHLKQLQKELLELRLGIFDLRTHRSKRNNKIADRNKCREIEEYIKQNATKVDEQKITQLRNVISQYEAELPNYSEDYWVDETVTQQSLFDDGENTIFRRNPNKEKRERLKTLIKNAKVEIQKEQNKSTLPDFAKAVEEVTHWDPYNQNVVSPFFDSEWMFGVADGFDIVIGNPPYIQLQNNGGELAKLYENCTYSTFVRTGDIYCLFYERGWQLLKRNGHLCYITSNKWMRAGYGEKTREFFANKTNPMLLIDFAGVKIFESATVDTNILLFAKSNNKHETVCAVTNKQNKDSVKNLSDFVQQQNSICNFTTSDSWVILSPIEQSIKKKIEAVGTPLKDWDINIYRGVLTGYNEAFIIDSEKRNEILANCQTEDERIRTAELIRPILRGRDIKRYGYVDNGLYLINTHNGIRGRIPRIKIEDYPAIKAHLDLFWDKIEKRADQGDTPYNLRNCAYLEDFSKQQIVWIELSDEPKFALAEEIMSVNTVFFMTGEHILHLLGLLNSKLITWYFKHCIGTTSGVGTNRWLKYTIEQIPMAPVCQKLEDLSLLISKSYDQEINQEIDLSVCRLYNLNDEETTYIVNQ